MFHIYNNHKEYINIAIEMSPNAISINTLLVHHVKLYKNKFLGDIIMFIIINLYIL